MSDKFKPNPIALWKLTLCQLRRRQKGKELKSRRQGTWSFDDRFCWIVIMSTFCLVAGVKLKLLRYRLPP